MIGEIATLDSENQWVQEFISALGAAGAVQSDLWQVLKRTSADRRLLEILPQASGDTIVIVSPSDS